MKSACLPLFQLCRTMAIHIITSISTKRFVGTKYLPKDITVLWYCENKTYKDPNKGIYSIYTLLLGKVGYNWIELKSSEINRYFTQIPSLLLLNDTLFHLVVRRTWETIYYKKTWFCVKKQPYYRMDSNYCMEVTGRDMKISRLSSQQLHHSLWSDTAVWASHWMQAEHMVSLFWSLVCYICLSSSEPVFQWFWCIFLTLPALVG